MTMTTKTTPIFRTWQRRLDSGVLTKSLCNQFAKSITRQWDGAEPAGFRSNITAEEACELVRQIRRQGGVRLTERDEKIGLTWLKNNGVKPPPRGLGLPQDAVDLFDHFSYQGDAIAHGYRNMAPVWRIHLTNGRMIDYSWAAWTAVAYDRSGDTDYVKRWRWVA